MRAGAARALVVAAAVLGACHAVDRSKFRTCDSAGFCKRHRSKTAEPAVRARARPARAAPRELLSLGGAGGLGRRGNSRRRGLHLAAV